MEEANIRDLGSKMASGEISARSLAESYLQRIEVMDRSGPSLNSIIELNPDALAIAGERDRERAAGKLRGPLHGIPILIKDNIDTSPSFSTGA